MWLLAEVLDAFSKGATPRARYLPPCLVTDAGDYSLAEWPMKRARWVAYSGTLCHSIGQIQVYAKTVLLPSKLRFCGHMPQLVESSGKDACSFIGHCIWCIKLQR